MKKKGLFITALATIAALALAGCGGGSSTSAGNEPSAEKASGQLRGEYFATYYSEETRILPANITTRTIGVDGDTDDWAGIKPLITDGAGNNWSEAPSGTDLTAVYLAQDETHLYFRIDLADGAPNTAGIRYRVYFSNQPYFPDNYLYLHGVYNVQGNQWQTVLYSWIQSTQTATEIGNDIAAAAIGGSSIEMRMPIDSLLQLGWTLDRWYIQGGVRSPPVGGTSYNLDRSDFLEARFQDIPNTSWKECGLATFTFDGHGRYTLSGTAASNAEGADVPMSGSGTYTVNPVEATVTMSGINGWKFGMQKTAKMLVGAAINGPHNIQGIGLLFKKGGTHGPTDSQRYSVSYNKQNNTQLSILSSVDTTAQGGITSTGRLNNASNAAVVDNLAVGTYTRNADGSGTTTFPSSFSPPGGTLGPAPGTTKYIPIIYSGAQRDDKLFSSSVKLDNQNRGRQRISANIKRPTETQSNHSLKGDFFLAAYLEDTNKRQSMFGTITFDGDGNYTLSVTGSTSDQGGNQSASESGTYSYDPATGTFLIGTTPETLVLNDEGDIALVTNLFDTSYQSMGVMVKNQKIKKIK